MQIVILCGGLGTRLGDISKKVPKSMVPFNGKPFLEHLLRFFSQQGFRNFLLCTGYKREIIENYFQDGSSLGISITYSVETEPLGTGGALLNAQELFEEQFILLWGDNFINIDFREYLERFLSDKQLKIAASVYKEDRPPYLVEPCNTKVENGYVTAYEKNTTKEGFKHVDTGGFYMKKEILNEFDYKKGEVVSFETEVYPILIRKYPVVAFTVPRQFDIGTPERIEQFQLFLNENRHLFN